MLTLLSTENDTKTEKSARDQIPTSFKWNVHDKSIPSLLMPLKHQLQLFDQKLALV